MNDVFISYSRRDSAFMKQLFEALKAANYQAWVDWEDIPKGERWLNEIYAGIEGANTLLVIVSPELLTSEICNVEITRALELKKRIVPIIRQDIDEKEVAGEWFNQDWEDGARSNWKTLKAINWLFFRETDDFDTAFKSLLETLQTDIDYVRNHTRYLERAIEWEKNNRSSAFLIHREDLTTAQRWVEIGRDERPNPTVLHEEFIRASALGAKQRTRVQRLAIGLILAGMFAVLAAIFAGISANNALDDAAAAERRENIANTRVVEAAETLDGLEQQSEIQRGVIESQRLAEEAIRVLEQDSRRRDIALLLSIRALNIAYSPLADRLLVEELGRRTFSDSMASVYSVAISADGQIVLTGSGDGTVRLWDVATGEIIHRLDGHTSIVSSVAFSPDILTTILTGSFDSTTRLWFQGELLHILEGHTDSVTEAIYMPDGQTVLTGSSDGTARLWDVTTGELIITLMGHSDDVVNIAISPDGKMALTGSLDRTVHLWNLETGELLYLLDAHSDMVHLVAFSPDGQSVLTGSRDGTVRLWNVETGMLHHSLTGHTSTVVSANYVSDRKTILTASYDGTAILWDIETGDELRRYDLQESDLQTAAYLPDENILLIGNANGTARIWDVETGEVVRVLHGHTNRINDVAFSSDGQWIVTGSLDGTARLWETDYHDFATYACTRMFRDFTPEERAEFQINDVPTCPQFVEE